MLQVLQKEYQIGVAEFDQAKEQIDFRKTRFGICSFWLGRGVAIMYIFKCLFSIKQMVDPVYSPEQIDKNTRIALLYLGLHKSDDSEEQLSLAIKVQYLSMLITAFLIVSNVQSFLRKLVVTLKYILRDNEIQLSFQTSLLAFSFVMGSYYLSILLQMSINLPEERRMPFQDLLDKFTTEVVLWTFDCFFLVSTVASSSMILFTQMVKRGPI